MSPVDGDRYEMGIRDRGLSDEEVDLVLRGRTPAARADLHGLVTDLSSLTSAVVQEPDPGQIQHWAAQAAASARLVSSDNGDLAATPASNADRPAQQASGLPKRRTKMIESIAAFLATTAGKVVAAGALVAATGTAGLAVTDNLPGQSDPAPVVTVDDQSPDVEAGCDPTATFACEDDSPDDDAVDAEPGAAADDCMTDVAPADVDDADDDCDEQEATEPGTPSDDADDDEADDEAEADDDEAEADDDDADDADDDDGADDDDADDADDDEADDDEADDEVEVEDADDAAEVEGLEADDAEDVEVEDDLTAPAVEDSED